MTSQGHSDPSDFFRPAIRDDVTAIALSAPFLPPISASSSTQRGDAGLTRESADQRRGLGQMGSLEGRTKRVGIFQRTVNCCLLFMALRRGNSDGFPFIHLVSRWEFFWPAL